MFVISQLKHFSKNEVTSFWVSCFKHENKWYSYDGLSPLFQESILELKTENYNLESQFRKQKSGTLKRTMQITQIMTTYQPYEQSLSVLGESQARVTVLEKELDKANRTIQKSKKAAEVQLLVRDNEVLQSKIRDQEEDFRSQNQTLLTELSKVGNLKYVNFYSTVQVPCWQI